jgi:hypothetical protein
MCSGVLRIRPAAGVCEGQRLPVQGVDVLMVSTIHQSLPLPPFAPRAAPPTPPTHA